MKVVRRAISILLVAVLAFVGLTAFRVWKVAREDNRSKADAIVVLGAAQYQGRPSALFEARLEQARALLTEGVAPRIITVGGSRPGDRFTEAAAGKRYLEGQGIEASAVVAVETGLDTLESVRAVAKYMQGKQWRSAVLVTDPWHSLRARTMASDAGIVATTSPSRSGPAVRTRATQIRYIARETLAYIFYTLFRRSADFEVPAT